MRELVYAPCKVEELIKKKWPDAKIKDASDYIHTERFEVEIDTTDEIFYRFAIREGFGLTCFGLRYGMLKGDKEIIEWIKDELDKLGKEGRLGVKDGG